MRPEIRPVTFALGELILGLLSNARAHFGLDLESFLILTCVTDATMRPFILDQELPRDVLEAGHTPDELRGGISRRLIADEVGLPRETVRRKAHELVAAGLLAIDDQDRLRVPTRLSDPELQRAIMNGHRLVLQYLGRLEAFGLDSQQLDKQHAG